MAAQKREITPNEQWLLDLERERYDRSYLKPRNRYEPQVVTVTRVAKTPTSQQQKERDRVMFHAGRYAAGARDEEATNANRMVGKLIQKGSK